MNLHVTNDSYGAYPVEIAKRIKNSGLGSNNLVVNLYPTSVFTDNAITYLPVNKTAFKNYINKLPMIDKVIFHPYNLTGYEFLKILIIRFPGVKVYWMCWSYELYNLPHLVNRLYDPFSARYIATKENFLFKGKKVIKKILVFTGVKKKYTEVLQQSYSLVHFFCSPFYSDYLFLKTIAPNSIKYLRIAYLSLNAIMPDPEKFRSTGNKIMIGHSASPDGNHYEMIQKVSALNKGMQVFLPLAYGDKEYGRLIRSAALKHFSSVEIMEQTLSKVDYYQKLTEVGWAIFNIKVQQAVGNIIALIWMGAKIFLDSNSSIYKDLTSEGVILFTIQNDLTAEALSNKLSFEEAENNRQKIREGFNEEIINNGWKEFLS